jgi:ubiquitin C-terminal hydrolase
MWLDGKSSLPRPTSSNPSALLRLIARRTITFEPHRQGDAHEIASHLLDILTEKDEIPAIRNVIEGACVSVVTCSTCGACSVGAQEPFTSLSVAMHSLGAASIDSNSMVRGFFAPTVVEDWRCGACGERGGQVSTRLWRLPRVLLVCIKRFDLDGTSINRSPVVPSKRLDFLLDENVQALMPGSPAEASVLNTGGKTDGRRGFRLVGVVCHIGSSQESGHYVACCRRPGAGVGWYGYDDTNVTHLPGGIRDVPPQAAYMLAYEMVRWG